MKKNLIIIATLLLFAGSLCAATITQTNTFSGQPNYSSVLTFNKFNDQGGAYTLNSIFITVVLNTSAGAKLGIDNDGAQSASGLAEFGSNGSITDSGVSLTKIGGGTFGGVLKSVSQKTMNLTSDDGDSIVYSTQGSDYDELVTSATSMSTNTYIKSSVFDEYIGTDTFDITYSVNQYLSMGAFSGAQFQGNPVAAGGAITVQYNYTIPEPATISMSVLVLLIGFWIRRRFID